MFEISNEEIVFYVILSIFVFLASVGALYAIYRDNKHKLNIQTKNAI